MSLPLTTRLSTLTSYFFCLKWHQSSSQFQVQRYGLGLDTMILAKIAVWLLHLSNSKFIQACGHLWICDRHHTWECPWSKCLCEGYFYSTEVHTLLGQQQMHFLSFVACLLARCQASEFCLRYCSRHLKSSALPRITCLLALQASK